jgi:hypothetical protein
MIAFSMNVNAIDDNNKGKIYFSPDANVKYRLFKTENLHIFIKLNTCDGTMTMVQFSTNSASERMEVPLNEVPYAYGEDAKPGRFYLYPTDNIWTFILLDQEDGRLWQIQWGTSRDRIFILRINP